MPNTSSRTVQIQFSGNATSEFIQSALENAVSPAGNQTIDLASGPNTITVPVSGNTIVTGLTIIMPPENTVLVTLKGDDGDVGIALNLVDPTSIGIDSSVTTIVLDAADDLDDVQLVWS